ncbi:hypothetical protein BGW36DRAFT_445664 [Talaromyces proteolyticus]|uniref:DUF7702 domain-containing protein n=1 Tax=Talaromyces proteolyticus TaxID=1131652 RepID=A0AAD4Q3U8_9EURO|nr:uncharacterized protein BGW36DRAFT_445664 [Talaromyces proteolyticus]KAH8702052.1 hypothetical protein BGW36DRAFT_445664 [Talaromyces proteolyticus]
MTLDANQIVSVVQIVVYVPALLLSCFSHYFVCNRHGFSLSSGRWYYTFTLSLIRIIGDVLLLLTYSNTSTGLLATAEVFDHIGLIPLLLATFVRCPLLDLSCYSSDDIRCRLDLANFSTTTPVTIKYFLLVQLTVVVGAVLGIIGAGQARSSTSPSALTDVAVLCYVAGYTIIVLIFFLILPFTREHVPDAERPLAPAIGLALPFVLYWLSLSIAEHNNGISNSISIGRFKRSEPSQELLAEFSTVFGAPVTHMGHWNYASPAVTVQSC